METESLKSPGAYPSTLWSEVRRGGLDDLDQALPALENLLTRYHPALLDHVLFKFRTSPEAAEDLLQSFYLEKVVLKRLLASADRQRGRFRTFLLNALDNFIISEQRKENTQRRRPDQGLVSLEELTPAEAGGLRQEESDRFDVAWARDLLAQVVTRMEAELLAQGHAKRWAVFERCVLAPCLRGTDVPSYRELAAELGLRSPAEVAQACFRAKPVYGRILREVIAEYAGEPSAVEEELRSLRRALGDG